MSARPLALWLILSWVGPAALIAQPPPKAPPADPEARKALDEEDLQRLLRQQGLRLGDEADEARAADEARPTEARSDEARSKAAEAGEGKAVRLVAPPPTVQGLERAKDLYQAVADLWSKGEAGQAVELIDDQTARCGGGEEGAACRQFLSFSEGFLLEQLSAADPGQRGELLGLAVQSYERALALAPDHGSTLHNLATVYYRLGEREKAADLLERAIAAAPEKAGTYALELGDYYLVGGTAEGAEAARGLYRLAAEKSPDAETPRRRILATYERAAETDPKEVLELGRGWAKSFPRVARSCFELAAKSAHQTQPEVAEEALLAWLEVGRRDGRRLSLRDLDTLGWGRDYPPLSGLRAYLEGPEVDPEPANWWLATDPRRSALAQVGLELGRGRLARKQPGAAEAIWRTALALAPPYEAYERSRELRGQPVARLDLHAELAALYFNHPDLDPDGSKFRAVEDELYGAKVEAYRLQDLDAMQSFHTVLGLIYAERGVWRSDHFAKNGAFQLASALSAAVRRQEASGFYQPLPHLQERLAGGYEILEQGERAARTYLAAAQGYLDTDALAAAERALVAVGRWLGELDEGARSALAQLRGVAASRRRLERLRAAEETLDAEAARGLLGAPWLDPSAPSVLAADFLERQRFKFLADLAGLFSGGEMAPVDLALAARALETATSGRIQLVGAGDLVRLDRLQGLVTGALGLPPAAPQVVEQPAQGRTLSLYLPGDREASAVSLAPEALVAARVVNTVGARTVRSAALTLAVDGDRIRVRSVDPSVDYERLLARLKRTPGVTLIR